MLLKGTVSRDFLLLVFFMNQFLPQPQSIPLGLFKFLRQFAEIFASQGATPDINDTGGMVVWKEAE
jgi:hypothetical protein